jgi:hypothetical protein
MQNNANGYAKLCKFMQSNVLSQENDKKNTLFLPGAGPR